MRTYLSPGMVVALSCDGAEREFQIDRIIGDGANCVAYEAHRAGVIGAAQNYRIKECYPYGAKIERQGTQLIWANEVERDAAFFRFRKAHELVIKLRNAETVGNNITAAELCEGNGTIYSVMEVNHAKTYDKDETCDLHRILETMRVLTEVVGNLHEQGYLHLDIKPSNFLVNHRPSTNVWLFDVDSLTSMEDLMTGNVRTTSFSQQWAAPEQIRGQVDKLCPATDLYAIGAILFEKVMGRPVSNEDTGLFANWTFEGGLFENVNPKVKRYLREIFQKTLSASVKRRYESASELSAVLNEASAAVAVPYLMSNYSGNGNCFVGRSQELKDISRAFASGAHIVCLRGIGGIGKSEIAKQYALRHENEYNAVLFLRYEDSVDDTLAQIEIQNFEGSPSDHKKQLHRLLGKGVLLIVDGVDSENVNIGAFQQLKCDVLLTSRLDWKECDLFTIEIKQMEKTEQMELFLKEFGGELNVRQQSTVLDILKMVEGYTLLIPLLAKQLRKGHCNIEETLGTLCVEGLKEASAGKVRHLKDGMPLSGTVYGVLLRVLNMASFSPEEAYIMRSMALLSKYRFDQKAFVFWIGEEYLEQIDDLVFAGWICREHIGERCNLSQHMVISALCFEELKPTLANCTGIRDMIWSFVSEFADMHKNPMAKYSGGYAPTVIQSSIQHRFDAFTDMMANLLTCCDLKNGEDVIFWIRAICKVSNVLYGEYSRLAPFLETIMAIEDATMPYLAEVALALQAFALREDDLESALAYTRIVVYTLNSVTNMDETVFRACFNFYQYICTRDMEVEAYWNISGFEELAEFIQKLWATVVEDDKLETENHDVYVLSEGECNITAGEAIAQTYDDFCWKISQKGIKAAENVFCDVDCDFEDLNSVEDYVADKFCKVTGMDVHETHVSTASDETVAADEEILFIQAEEIEKRINEILPCNPVTVMGLWVVMNPPVLTDDERKTLCCQLNEIDLMLPYHKPSVAEKTAFVYSLTKMEAAFSYAYACAKEWEKYHFHAANLLKYYNALICGRHNNNIFKRASINDINSGLPGAASLLNKYGRILPPQYALEFISEIVKIMEAYHSSEHLSIESLFDVYEMSLKFANEAEDNAAIAHFSKRIQAVSGVFFSKKDD